MGLCPSLDGREGFPGKSHFSSNLVEQEPRLRRNVWSFLDDRNTMLKGLITEGRPTWLQEVMWGNGRDEPGGVGSSQTFGVL